MKLVKAVTKIVMGNPDNKSCLIWTLGLSMCHMKNIGLSLKISISLVESRKKFFFLVLKK